MAKTREKLEYVSFLRERVEGSGDNKTVHLEAEDWRELRKYWKIEME